MDNMNETKDSLIVDLSLILNAQNLSQIEKDLNIKSNDTEHINNNSFERIKAIIEKISKNSFIFVKNSSLSVRDLLIRIMKSKKIIFIGCGAIIVLYHQRHQFEANMVYNDQTQQFMEQQQMQIHSAQNRKLMAGHESPDWNIENYAFEEQQESGSWKKFTVITGIRGLETRTADGEKQYYFTPETEVTLKNKDGANHIEISNLNNEDGAHQDDLDFKMEPKKRMRVNLSVMDKDEDIETKFKDVVQRYKDDMKNLKLPFLDGSTQFWARVHGVTRHFIIDEHGLSIQEVNEFPPASVLFGTKTTVELSDGQICFHDVKIDGDFHDESDDLDVKSMNDESRERLVKRLRALVPEDEVVEAAKTSDGPNNTPSPTASPTVKTGEGSLVPDADAAVAPVTFKEDSDTLHITGQDGNPVIYHIKHHGIQRPDHYEMFFSRHENKTTVTEKDDDIHLSDVVIDEKLQNYKLNVKGMVVEERQKLIKKLEGVAERAYKYYHEYGDHPNKFWAEYKGKVIEYEIGTNYVQGEGHRRIDFVHDSEVELGNENQIHLLHVEINGHDKNIRLHVQNMDEESRKKLEKKLSGLIPGKSDDTETANVGLIPVESDQTGTANVEQPDEEHANEVEDLKDKIDEVKSLPGNHVSELSHLRTDLNELQSHDSGSKRRRDDHAAMPSTQQRIRHQTNGCFDEGLDLLVATILFIIFLNNFNV